MKAPSLGQLNRVVQICGSQDVVTENSEFRLARAGIRDTWARIEPVRESYFSREGFSGEERPTHRATVRAMADIDLTVSAWVYESRAISADLWYKVIGYRESPDGQWWQLDLRIYSREDQVSPADHAADLGLSRRQNIPL